VSKPYSSPEHRNRVLGRKPSPRVPSQSDQWAPPGFKAHYRQLAIDPATPAVLSDLLSLVGYEAAAEDITTWSLQHRVEAEAFAVTTHLRASDNVLRAHPKPAWFPDPWLGPETGEGIFGGPSGTPLRPNAISVGEAP